MELLFSAVSTTLNMVPDPGTVTRCIVESPLAPPLRRLHGWLFGDDEHPPHEFVCKPTILLSVACFFLWAAAAACGFWLIPLLPFASWSWTLGHVTCFLLCLLTSFFQFTVAHDASHGAISKRYPIVNEVMGRFSAFFLYPAPFSAWRAMHHAHHKFTNDPQRDPDYWTSHGTLPVFLRCMTQIVAYALFYIGPFQKTRPLAEVVEFYLQMVLYVAIPPAIFWYGGISWFLLSLELWIIPAILSLALLSFFLDLVPHAECDETPQSDCFKTTAFINTAIDHDQHNPTWASWAPRWFITLMMQFQDYHHVHHLNPTLPFFLYISKHHEKENLYHQKGLPVRSLASTIERAFGIDSNTLQDPKKSN